MDTVHVCHGYRECNDSAEHATRTRSTLLVGHCILDALDHHEIHEIGAQDVLPEALLLKERECTQRGRRVTAQTRSVIRAVA